MATLGAINGSSVLSPQLSFLSGTLAGIINQQISFSPDLLGASTLSTLGLSTAELTSFADPLTQLSAGYLGGLIDLFV